MSDLVSDNELVHGLNRGNILSEAVKVLGNGGINPLGTETNLLGIGVSVVKRSGKNELGFLGNARQLLEDLVGLDESLGQMLVCTVLRRCHGGLYHPPTI